jgi:hypothetical protein
MLNFAKAISSIIYQYKMQPGLAWDDPIVFGKVSEKGNLSLRKVGYYKSSWAPVFYGRLKLTDSGAKILGEFKTPVPHVGFS